MIFFVGVADFPSLAFYFFYVFRVFVINYAIFCPFIDPEAGISSSNWTKLWNVYYHFCNFSKYIITYRCHLQSITLLSIFYAFSLIFFYNLIIWKPITVDIGIIFVRSLSTVCTVFNLIYNIEFSLSSKKWEIIFLIIYFFCILFWISCFLVHEWKIWCSYFLHIHFTFTCDTIVTE